MEPHHSKSTDKSTTREEDIGEQLPGTTEECPDRDENHNIGSNRNIYGNNVETNSNTNDDIKVHSDEEKGSIVSSNQAHTSSTRPAIKTMKPAPPPAAAATARAISCDKTKDDDKNEKWRKKCIEYGDVDGDTAGVSHKYNFHDKEAKEWRSQEHRSDRKQKSMDKSYEMEKISKKTTAVAGYERSGSAGDVDEEKGLIRSIGKYSQSKTNPNDHVQAAKESAMDGGEWEYSDEENGDVGSVGAHPSNGKIGCPKSPSSPDKSPKKKKKKKGLGGSGVDDGEDDDDDDDDTEWEVITSSERRNQTLNNAANQSAQLVVAQPVDVAEEQRQRAILKQFVEQILVIPTVELLDDPEESQKKAEYEAIETKPSMVSRKVIISIVVAIFLAAAAAVCSTMIIISKEKER